MRKYIKTDILNRMKTVEDANVTLLKYIDLGKMDAVSSILPDLQAAIIEIGNILEGQLGEGCEIVKPLEELCEDIWKISELCDTLVSSETLKTQRKICKGFPGKISRFKRLLSEVKEEKVALFLPYKAAMWDSLYGAYKKASEDENCEVVVVPIPYFEKNNDGTTGKMYYEKDLFDQKMPLYDYDKIDYKQIHPEEVYIHNPYDECNYVTTIHPYFYCKNLKTFADKIIYIPYFVHQNDYVKEEYCVLPGTVYSDEVWLQSEKVKEQYIKFYKEQIPDADDIGKFKVVESSKLAAYDLKEDNIPQAWKELIYKDGKRRKVIFFNTHLSCLMQVNSEDFFLKIEEVFQTFKDNPDVVMLWRPHPLTMSTIKSMNPEVEEKYLGLVERYKEEIIGIYDDSSDVHRAVNIADAYYGSRSSVVEMFKVQKKPLMIMNLTLHQ